MFVVLVFLCYLSCGARHAASRDVTPLQATLSTQYADASNGIFDVTACVRPAYYLNSCLP